MDFLYGILLIIIIIFALYNFGSVSLSDSQNKQIQSSNQSNQPNNTNYLFASRTSNEKKLPEPMIANSPLALNNKINLEVQTYDYNKYFFV